MWPRTLDLGRCSVDIQRWSFYTAAHPRSITHLIALLNELLCLFRSVLNFVSDWDAIGRLHTAFLKLRTLMQQEEGRAITAVQFSLLWVHLQLAEKAAAAPGDAPLRELWLSSGGIGKFQLWARPPWSEEAAAEEAPSVPRLAQHLLPVLDVLTEVANGPSGMRALAQALTQMLPVLPVLAVATSKGLLYKAMDATSGVLYTEGQYGVEMKFAGSGMWLLRDATAALDYSSEPMVAGVGLHGTRASWPADLIAMPQFGNFLQSFVTNVITGRLAGTMQLQANGVAVLTLEAARMLFAGESGGEMQENGMANGGGASMRMTSPRPSASPSASPLVRYMGCLSCRLGIARAASHKRVLCSITRDDPGSAEMGEAAENGGKDRAS